VRHLAVIELFPRGHPPPELARHHVGPARSQIQLMRDIHRAAASSWRPRTQHCWFTAITGIVHFALTTPEAIDLRSPDEVRPLVRRAVDLIHNRVAGTSPEEPP
jgi:hypothetical protein